MVPAIDRGGVSPRFFTHHGIQSGGPPDIAVTAQRRVTPEAAYHGDPRSGFRPADLHTSGRTWTLGYQPQLIDRSLISPTCLPSCIFSLVTRARSSYVDRRGMAALHSRANFNFISLTFSCYFLNIFQE